MKSYGNVCYGTELNKGTDTACTEVGIPAKKNNMQSDKAFRIIVYPLKYTPAAVRGSVSRQGAACLEMQALR